MQNTETAVNSQNDAIDGVPVWDYDKLDVNNPEPGLYANVPMQTYHDEIDALSSSQIRAACKSMLNYKRYMAKRGLFKTSEALEFGKAFALLCEAPEAIVEGLVREASALTFKSKAWQADMVDFAETIFVKPGSLEMLKAMMEGYRNHPVAKHYINAEWKELTVIWYCEHTGAKLKARPDKYMSGELIDDKTMRGDRFSQREIKNTVLYDTYRYDIQSTLYFDGLRAVGVNCQKANICFVQKEEIFPDVAVYGINPEEQDNARQAYIEAIRGIQKAKEDDIYPGIAPEIICELWGFDEPETTFE